MDRITLYHEVQLAPMPDPDKKLSLNARVKLANEWPADLFLSIHCNSSDNPEAHGFEVWTSVGDTNADKYASSIFAELEALELHGRADMVDGDPDKESQFYVLRNTTMPAVLVEFGFITNSADLRDLQSQSLRNLMARAVSVAVEKTNTMLGIT